MFNGTVHDSKSGVYYFKFKLLLILTSKLSIHFSLFPIILSTINIIHITEPTLCHYKAFVSQETDKKHDDTWYRVK